ncbi:hypothetical protein DNTS_014587 [Danionella cerebrum]|uniref:Uncharacterized protein n=1 Tax=Danionella cerebrum TaxID=2873325 RepID=A0A553Q771_9TELE|nr:hypothetical protein DNTS_014587 [Danionella translucida]TRY85781.1 hypothetical protein DNTS_014587 [Danionella translucida]
MSSSILRRNSSKKGLEKLQRITVQRSLEDAEEVERERRRRARASSSTDPFQPSVTSQNSHQYPGTLENQGLDDLSVNCPSFLEEDEGFSDWTHLIRRKQGQTEHADMEKHVHGSQLSNQTLSCSATQKHRANEFTPNNSIPLLQTRPMLTTQKNLEHGDDEEWSVRGKERDSNITPVEREQGEIRRRFAEEDDPRSMKSHESSYWKTQNQSSAKVKKGEISYTSTVVLQQKGRQCSINGRQERRINDSVSDEVFEKNREGNQQPSDSEDKPHEAVQTMREEERERKRRNVMDKLKRLGITERTESLNRSIKKKSSAIQMECCKEGYVLKQMDVPNPPEPVSARKSLFEAGEAWNQNSVKAISSKDAEGMKVGITDLINQFVKGNPDVNMSNPSSKAACPDVKAGEVRNIKSMWENLRDSPQDKPCAKGLAGKKYKFVESGHGKYQKIFIDDETN